MIGGKGADSLAGGSGDDFVITGYTKYDNHTRKLDSIMKEWDTDRETSERLESLKGFIYSSQLRFNDGAVDQMFDNRDELDLFVFDRHDAFVDI